MFFWTLHIYFSVYAQNLLVSAREMSLSIGQNPSYINHIESGQGTPSLSGIIYICEYLGITPQEFFDEKNNHPAEIKEIVEILSTLNEKDFQTIYNLIKMLKK